MNFFFQYKTTQQVIFLENIFTITGSINSFFSSIYDYVNLKKNNEILHTENSLLKNNLNNVYELIDNSKTNIIDTIINENKKNYVKKYEILGAKVIKNNTTFSNNYFQINRGKLQGIEPDMGVVTSNGIAGVIINVTDNFANVLSVLNSTIKISSKVKNTKYIGYVEWDGKNIKELIMKNYPVDSKVKIGDTVVTSEYSDKFINSTTIGIISNIIMDNGKNNYNLIIKLSSNFEELDYVYAIKNLFKNEIEYLNDINPY